MTFESKLTPGGDELVIVSRWVCPCGRIGAWLESRDIVQRNAEIHLRSQHQEWRPEAQS